MTRHNALFGIALLAMVIVSGPARAYTTMICSERDQIVKKFEKTHGEVPTVMGIISAQRVLEILVSPEGQWTAIYSYPDGKSCIFVTGSDWIVLSERGRIKL